MQIADVSTPVVVLSPHHHGALGIFRSLGSLGVAVYAVEDGEWAPPLRSRYCRGVFHWDVRSAPASDSVAALLKIARNFDRRPILIPPNDATAVLVQEHSEELRSTYKFPILPSGLVHRLSSKKELYFLCHERNFPTPETAFPQSRGDVLRLLDKLTYPVVLKGIDDGLAAGQTKVSMRIVHSADELLKCYDQMHDAAQLNLMVQEYIPGDTDSVWMFNGYFDANSECLAGFTGRKLRQRPANTGVTTLGICLRNETVDKSIRTLLQSAGYRGMVDIGCRYDKRDGQYKLLDVNPRIGCTFRLFVDPAGMDVVRACYLDLTGQPVHADTAQEGRKWLVENQDVLELPVHLKARKITILDWLLSLRGVQETAWFHWRDLRPVWAMCAGLLRTLFRGQARNKESCRSEVPHPSPVSSNL
jgi:D-aspartate ligase